MGAEWPTPTAKRYGTQNNGDPGDGRGSYATKGKASLDTIAKRKGGTLNPEWVEALMGFPLGWTHIAPKQADLFGGQPDTEPPRIGGSPQWPFPCTLSPNETSDQRPSEMLSCRNAPRSLGK